MTVDKLFSYACSGKIKALKNYYDNGGEINQRLPSPFNTSEISLIMGAFRNNQFETVDYLLSVGETVTDEERADISRELKRIETMRKIIG